MRIADHEKTWQLPEYTVRVLRAKSAKYCLAVFVINEGKKIAAQLERMIPFSGAVDIIIADGGSTDGSLKEEILKKFNIRALLVKTGKGKLSAQMRMALAWALKEGYEGVITIDGNNKDDPGAIPYFIKALDEGYDHVQGSRFIPSGEAVNTPWARFVGIKLVHSPLISIAAGFRYTDTTNGFRAYSKKLLTDSRILPFRDIFSQYELHYYLAIRAARLGFRVKEVPVKRAYPSKGPVPTKISPLKGNALIIKTLIKACLGRFDPS